MRGLFPEESFDEHNLRQLNDMSIRMLKKDERKFNEDGLQVDNGGNTLSPEETACNTPAWREEATQLQRWVEAGVMDALERGYLKTMYFGISEDASGNQLLEEYIYSFTYGEHGVKFEFAAGKHKKGSKYNSAQRPHPPGTDERYLFIKLTYHDHTPDEYEPPEFHGVAEEDAIGHFERKPFSMDVGAMDTHHHTVCLRVKSVLDACDDLEHDDPDMAEAEASQQLMGHDDQVMQDVSAMAVDGTVHVRRVPGEGKTRTSEEQAGDVAEKETLQQKGTDLAASLQMLMETEKPTSEGPTPQPGAPSLGVELTLMPQQATAPYEPCKDKDHHNAAADNDSEADETCATEDEPGVDQNDVVYDSQISSGEAYERVRTYCLQQHQVNFVDALSSFYQLPGSQLQLLFDGLVREGVLQPGPDNDTFLVVGAKHQHDDDALPAAGSSKGKDASAAASGKGPAQGHKKQDTHPAEAAGDTSEVLQGDDSPAGHGHGDDAEQMTGQMSVLSVDDGRRGAAAAAEKHKGLLNGSVLGKNMRAGSEATEQAGHIVHRAGPPTAADHQLDAPAAEEPSVQLGQDASQQCYWFDASQHSNQQQERQQQSGKTAKAIEAGEGSAAAVSSTMFQVLYLLTSYSQFMTQ
eukprot:gene4406-4659_t